MSEVSELTEAQTKALLVVRKVAYLKRTEGYYFYQPQDYQKPFEESTAHRIVIHGGNRSGKTQHGVKRTLAIMAGEDILNEVMGDAWKPPIYWRWNGAGMEEQVRKVIIEWFRKMTPRSWCEGGEFKVSQKSNILKFAERSPCKGGWIEFMSYDQDPESGSGRPLHGTGFDEAYKCPRRFRNQNLSRLLDFHGVAWAVETPEEGDATWSVEWYAKAATRTVYNQTSRLLELKIDDMLDSDYAAFCYPTVENEWLYPDHDKTQKSPAIEQIIKDCEGDPMQLLIRLYGEFVSIGGLVYKMLDPMFHVKHPAEFHVDGTWTKYVDIDPGIRKDHRVAWHSVGPPRRVSADLEVYPLYFYRDAYILGTMEDLCLGIRRLGGSEHYHAFNFDPNWDWDNKAAANKDGKPFNLHDSLREAMDKTGYGDVPLVPARKDRSMWFGIDQVSELLKVKEVDKLPLLAFSHECSSLFDEMRRYACIRQKEKDPTAHRPRIRKIDDDGPDCVRIAVTSPMEYSLGYDYYGTVISDINESEYGLTW